MADEAGTPPPDPDRRIVRVEGVPEVLWQLRHAMADLLRKYARQDPSPRVAKRLMEVAAHFETGAALEPPKELPPKDEK